MRRIFITLALILLLSHVAVAAATLDTQACANQAATNTTLDVTLTVANNTNRVLVLLIGGGGVTEGVVSSVTGAGGTWTSVGSGSGLQMKGTVYKNIAPSTGSQTAHISWASGTSQPSGACLYSYYNADQTTGVDSFQFRSTTGDLTVVSASGDATVSAQFDTFNNRAVTGCTSSTDTSTYGATGVSDAHCAGAATTVFTWAGYSGTSVGVAANVKQVSAGGATKSSGLLRGQ